MSSYDLNGTSGNDSLNGGSGSTEGWGYAGHDTLKGNGGSDTLYGGSDNDELFGDSDNDKLYGGTGNDTIDGGTGSDSLYGEDGNDSLTGGDNGDKLYGGNHNDTLVGGSSKDTMEGGSGDDVLVGDGSDYAKGGDGNDTAVVTWTGGGGSYDGGKGTDTLRIELTAAQYANSAIYNELKAFGQWLAKNSNAGTDGGDEFEFCTIDLEVEDWEKAELYVDGVKKDWPGTEPVLAPLFTGNPDGVDFNSVVDGTYIAGTQYDALDGNDVVTLANDATEAAQAGYDTTKAFNAGSGNDSVTGGTLNDTVVGGAGNDTINSAGGNDVLRGDGDLSTTTTTTLAPAGGLYDVGGATGVSIAVENRGDVSVGYRNTFGYYLADAGGNPISGGIVFASTFATTGQSATINLSAGQLTGAASVGFFIIPDGFAHNGSLTNGTAVTFTQVSGKWTAFVGNTALTGTGNPAYFSNPALNPDGGYDHETDSSTAGNSNWEDLAGGGDQDKNDVNMQIGVVKTVTTTPAGGNDVLNGGEGSDTINGDDGNDTVAGGAGGDLVDGDAGDDVGIFTAGQGGSDVYDGGTGTDTLRIELTSAQYGNATTFAELVAFGQFLAANGNAATDSGPTFNFATLNLSAQDWEGAELFVDGQPVQWPVQLPPLFTPNPDVVDLNNVVAGLYQDGTQYDALESDDHVILAVDAAEAAQAGYDVSQAFKAGSGNDTVVGGTLDDTVAGGTGNDSLTGGEGNDVLRGNGGAPAVPGPGAVLSLTTANAGVNVAATVSAWAGSGVTVEAFTTDGNGGYAPASFGTKNVAFSIDGSHTSDTGLHGSYAYSGLAVAGGIDGGEIDTGNGSDTDGGEVLRLTFADPMQSVTIQLSALFDGETVIDAERGPYDAGYLEQAQWTAWGANGEVLTGSVEGSVNGLVDFTVAPGWNVVKIEVSALDAGAGNSGNNSDFLLRSVSGTTAGAPAETDNDILLGGNGNDSLDGDEGDDTLDGGAGSDTVYGDDGNDVGTYHGESAVDFYDGGIGTDTIQIHLTSAQYANAATVAELAQFNLFLQANNNPATDSGAIFSFSTLGLSAQDWEAGELYIDGVPVTWPVLPPLFTPGNDSVNFDNVVAGTYLPGTQYNALDGDDYVLLPYDATEAAEAGYDTDHAFFGGDGRDTLIGGALKDTIHGDGGDDALYGSWNADALYGGAGNDILYFSTDFLCPPGLTYYVSADDCSPAVGWAANLEGLYLSLDIYDGGADVDTLTGSNAGDVIVLDNGNLPGPRIVDVEVIDGAEGNDLIDLSSLQYSYGDVTLLGGNGNDTVWSNVGDDLIDGGNGDDFLIGNLGADTIQGGAGNDLAYGGAGDDVIIGDNVGDDTLSGGSTTTVITQFPDGRYDVTGAESVTIALANTGNSSAGYQNAFGYYFADASGNPVSGLVVWDNQHNTVGQTYNATFTPAQLAGVAHIGLFVIPNGDALNTLASGTPVTFQLVSGAWTAFVGATPLAGQDAPVLFSDPTLNAGFDYEQDSTLPGNSNWEDIRGGGDVDFNDVNMQVDLVRSDTLPGNLNDTLHGDCGDDQVNGLYGDDVVYGGGGNDTLEGGDGDDTIQGDDGDDVIVGGDGDDSINGDRPGLCVGDPQPPADFFPVLPHDISNVVLYLEGGSGNDIIKVKIDEFDDAAQSWRDADDLFLADWVATNYPGYTLVAVTVKAGANSQPGFGPGEGQLFILDPAYTQATLPVAAHADQTWLIGAALLAGLTVSSGAGAGGTYDDTIQGGNGNDWIDGNAGDDLIAGEEGDDTLSGSCGDDTMLGGNGEDTLYGGDGDDLLYGGANVVMDALYGGDGNDTLYGDNGESGPDCIHGDAGDDVMYGQGGNDDIDGAEGNDLAYGGAGSDSMYGGTGDDTMYGEEDDDLMLAGEGNDLVYGGTGNESVYSWTGNDTLYGEDGDDLLVGDDGNDSLTGGAGNDQLYGMADADTIYGNDGNDAAYGGAGNDYIYTGAGDDTLYGEAGDDLLYGGAGNDDVDGGDGNDTLYGDNGQSGDDRVWGGTGNDLIFGQDQDDSLYGEDGDDTIYGGAGNEYAWGGAGNDTVYAEEGDDRVAGEDGEDLIYGGTGNDSLYGGTGADTLHGEDGDDKLYQGEGADLAHGGNGDDSIWGAAGDDTQLGGAGNDQLVGDEGNDSLDGGADDDQIYGMDGDDTLNGDVGNDYLAGGLGNDLAFGGEGLDWIGAGNDGLYGKEGNDSLYGGLGADWMEGGAGTDLLYGGADNDVVAGGEGDDSVYADDGDDYAFGNEGNDLVFGGAGNDRVEGYDGHDTLHGDDGDDIVLGGGGDDTMYGGTGQDSLYGWSGADVAFGGDEDDLVVGDAGNDTLYGDAGNDSVYGGEGDDELFGGDGDDYVEGNDGNDAAYGGAGNDWIDGGTGNDSLSGGDGSDTLIGGEGHDEVYGGTGSDVAAGGAGDDTISGDDGDDALYGQDGDDFIYGGDGNDYAEGGAGNDALWGAEGADSLYGQDGDDVVFGGSGNDWIEGGLGNDSLFGGDAHDLIVAGEGADQVFGGAGDDLLAGNEGDDSLWGGAGNDWLYGQDGSDVVYAGSGDDHVEAGAGTDTVAGGQGADYIHGGADDDVLIGDDGDLPGLAPVGEPRTNLYSLTGVVGSVVLTVSDLVSNAGYHNSYGWYLADASGNPISGAIIWSDVVNSLGQTETITLTPGQLGGAAYVGFFVVPNGANHNPGLVDGTAVTFTQVGGEWTAFAGSNPLTGTGAPALFVDPAINPAGFDYEVDNGVPGNSNWEDIVGGGDMDFDDVAVQVEVAAPGLGGNDTIIGGAGNDWIAGNGGDDVLVGDEGDSTPLAPVGGAATNLYSLAGLSDVLELSLTDKGSDAGYKNSYGWYLADGDGNPLSGAVVWTNVQNHVGETQYLTLNPADYAGAAYLGFFIIPNGATKNPALANGTDVTFAEIGGKWTAMVDGSPLAGQGAPALFTDPLINPDTFDYELDNGAPGNSNWEDILGGGDLDFNDINVQVNLSHVLPGGNDTLSGGEGHDSLYGNGGDDLLTGGAGNDLIYGGYGNDVLDGGDGSDTMNGGMGNDVYWFGRANAGTGANEDWIVDTDGSNELYIYGDYAGKNDGTAGVGLGDLTWTKTGNAWTVSFANGDGDLHFDPDAIGKISLVDGSGTTQVLYWNGSDYAVYDPTGTTYLGFTV